MLSAHPPVTAWSLPGCAHSSRGQWWRLGQRYAAVQLEGLAAGESHPKWFRPVTGPDPGYKQPWRGLGYPSMHHHMAVRPCHRCTWPWRPMMGVRPAVCKCTAGGASLQQVPREHTEQRGQLGAQAGVSQAQPQRVPAFAGVGGTRGWGGTRVAGVSKHRLSGGESPVKSVVTVQAPGSSVAKAAVLICRTGQWAPFFLPLRIWHWNTGDVFWVTPQLCWSLVGETEVGPSSNRSPEGQSWSLSPLFLSLCRRNSFQLGVSFDYLRMWPWGQDDESRKETFFLPFLWGFLRFVLVSWVAEVSLIPELSQHCFGLWIALYLIDFCGGMEAEDLYSAILVKSLITLYFINRMVERKDDFIIVL